MAVSNANKRQRVEIRLSKEIENLLLKETVGTSATIQDVIVRRLEESLFGENQITRLVAQQALIIELIKDIGMSNSMMEARMKVGFQNMDEDRRLLELREMDRIQVEKMERFGQIKREVGL